jgi:4a-hydroxytetrahydrobiopterin dehydratase
MPSRKKLTVAEIETALKSAPGWGYSNDRLRSEFQTFNFANGVAFINQIGKIADEINHHPDVLLTYPRVTIEIYTHDVGGITEFDFELARRISALAE